jgi:anionic cell wall polymer biosynthesis LytR-Cps2A-Psr (LCP) family protein
MPFGDALALPGGDQPTQALTDLLGLRIDGSWVLTKEGLSGLVDAVGGIDAEVDIDVVTQRGGKQVVVVPAGQQHLDGAGAAAYATFHAPDEPEQARLARFGEVLDQVLRRLPAQQSEVAALLGELDNTSATTLQPAELAGLLTELRGDTVAGRATYQQLPVRAIDTGAEHASYSLDENAAKEVLDQLFAGAAQATAGQVRVLVENGVRTPGLVEKARAELVGAGYRFVGGGNAEESTLARSVVLIPDLTTKSVTTGRAVARTLGLPASSVRVTEQGQTVAEVIVKLGADYGS